MATREMITAIQEGNLETVKQLFQSKGKEKNSVTDNDLLYFSSIQAQHSITEYFLDQGCDPNGTCGKYNILPLQAALAAYNVGRERTSLALCTLLKERGACLDKTSADGRTPLHSAAQSGTPEIVKYFLAQGALPNVIDEEGNTPLLGLMQYRRGNYQNLFVIDEDSKSIIKLLLENGADPTLPNYKQKTLESFLAEHEQGDERLPEYKADIDTVREIRQYCEAYQGQLKQR